MSWNISIRLDGGRRELGYLYNGAKVRNLMLGGGTWCADQLELNEVEILIRVYTDYFCQRTVS